MKTTIKKITMSIALFGYLFTNAQTITYSNFSKSLTTTLHAVLANKTSFSASLTTNLGNGVTWNASGLTRETGTPQINMIYESPSKTPHGSLYPKSNYSRYDPALTSVLSYGYFNFSSDSIVKVGDYSPSTEHEIYTNPDKLMIFPFAFGQSFTDSYAKTNYSNATNISSYQTGTRTTNFAGFGTLVLPQGSFSNVALIAELRTNSLGPNSPTFTWYDISNGKQLLMYHENNGSVTIAYNIDAPTSIDKIDYSNNNIELYPNPATSTLNITCNLSIEKAEIYNLAGMLQSTNMINKSIDISALGAGIYFVKVYSENGTSTQKFVKQ